MFAVRLIDGTWKVIRSNSRLFTSELWCICLPGKKIRDWWGEKRSERIPICLQSSWVAIVVWGRISNYRRRNLTTVLLNLSKKMLGLETKNLKFWHRMVSHFLSVLKDKFRLEPSDVGVQESGRAVLDCAPPRGSPPPTVFWKRDGRMIDFERETRWGMGDKR